MIHKSTCTSSSCSGCSQGDALRQLGDSESRRGNYTVALAGNPNTGKSTIFNRLTGLKQHTGNWPGKTVERAEGAYAYGQDEYRIVDLPGTYSLLSTSEDEEVARNFILFGNPDVTVIVADATRLERNLNLVLQTMQISDKVVLCINLLDEARRNKVDIDLRALGKRLGIPVVGCSARSGEGINGLLSTIAGLAHEEIRCKPYRSNPLEGASEVAVGEIVDKLTEILPDYRHKRWLAYRLIERDDEVIDRLSKGYALSGQLLADSVRWKALIARAGELGDELGDDLHDKLTEGLYKESVSLCEGIIRYEYANGRAPLDVKLDRILTSRLWGFPIMLLMLVAVLWLTIVGSNYPSSFLGELLVGQGHPWLRGLFESWAPWWLTGFLIDGVYLSTAWVVSVMLPPMAIFFPLFTLLEDFGYLPRVAFNLDELFRRSGAHGKQALTMTMGFGCNAAGVVSTRIIDSPRERLIAIVTNNFSLCNGRWPLQILIASLYIGASVPAAFRATASIGAVVVVALLGIAFMFFSSWGLSRTLLKGSVSTFHLELPPYRPPQFWQTLYTSLVDRTLIVLWRAIIFAIPAGALIWLSSNIMIGDLSIAARLAHSLDGIGWLMGLNGVILLAYILAIPANEIVIPTILMLTLLVTGNTEIGAGAGVMFEDENITKQVFDMGGWTLLTGVNLMLFSLLHNPCSTTLYTIYKETKSGKWTAISAFLPLLLGFLMTSFVAFVWRLF
ncbi:ferrous iron transport protein B [Porphyromonas crevioricanis]|uniref:Ferrous iron transport protein B n=1 Tax=Porphyromonas crevioricanis TaxID=393921 RepID=A0A2X4SUZ4_9PORP|nr:ferrous iron transport protein B [Porphyromonas crevioricanis]KGN95947.1 iron transporter FeoB [Porphyromonas crevioricanis]GAD07812.1 ferrous iron transport protein B [Porphyromonas crevioricanis JCM 13913]SQH73571.1 Ferrous iron transport protein B [Porphyromonas crevioricanis]